MLALKVVSIILQMVNQCLQLTVWSQELSYDRFVGEVLLDLTEAQLDGQVGPVVVIDILNYYTIYILDHYSLNN